MGLCQYVSFFDFEVRVLWKAVAACGGSRDAGTLSSQPEASVTSRPGSSWCSAAVTAAVPAPCAASVACPHASLCTTHSTTAGEKARKRATRSALDANSRRSSAHGSRFSSWSASGLGLELGLGLGL